jgi:branched-chain amino acid transport system ATP-binding protein
VAAVAAVTLLSVEELSRSFGGVAAVESLSFALAAGVVHSIIGPNGAGKTTLFNLITGIYRPTSGRIRIDGEDVTGWRPSDLAQRGLSRTFQNLQVFMNMSALENVMVGLHRHADTRLSSALFRLHGLGRAERESAATARRLLAEVGLADYVDAAADAMPYGALKRLEIARALASRPRLLLLDEPAAGLNPAETQEIDRLIRRVAETGVTVVLVEHNMRLVMGISDHILVLNQGRLLACGSAAEIRTNPDVIRAYLGNRAGERRMTQYA